LQIYQINEKRLLLIFACSVYRISVAKEL